MDDSVILVIDQGTSASKAFLFDRDLNQIYAEKIRLRVHRPKSGWVEMNSKEILDSCLKLIQSLLNVCQSRTLTPLGLGMAFQRSTFLFWDRDTGKPLTNAMNWQDIRASELTGKLVDHGKSIQRITGIPLTPHRGGPKFLFSILSDPDLKSQVDSGNVLFGPISTFITHRMTCNALIDESIAGRTLLLNLEKMTWDTFLLDLFNVPIHCLPKLVPTCCNFGYVQIDSQSIPLICVMGDQQASLVGQGHWNIGDVAMNFGTSGSVLMYSGRQPNIVSSLLCNVLYSFEKKHHFLLEGTINSVGSLFRWLEEYLNIPHSQMNWETRCANPTAGILVPGINGISAPYWTGEFESTLSGLSETSHPNEIVRAGMESIGFLVNDICQIIQKEAKAELGNIIVSGGYSKSILLQFIADILNKPVWNSAVRDMTALGVARLIAKKFWGKPIRGKNNNRQEKFIPTVSDDARMQKISQWHNALRQIGIIKMGKPKSKRS